MEDVQADRLVATKQFSPTIHPMFPSDKTSFIDRSMEKIEPVIIYPEPGDLNSGGPITFMIHESSVFFIDLSSLQLEVKLEMQKADGAVVAGGDKAYFSNNLLSLLFPIRKVSINNQNVETQYSGAYIARLKHLLESDEHIVKSRGVTRGIFPLDANKESSPLSAGILAANATRQAWSKTTPIHLKGYLDLDICNVNKWLVDLCTVKIVLEPASDALCINSDAVDEAYRKMIKSIKLHVCRVQPTPSGFLSVTKHIQKNPCEYIFSRHIFHNEIVASGQSSVTITRPFLNRIPHLIYIFMVKQSADRGVYTEDVGFFQHNNITNYRIMQDGKVLAEQDLNAGQKYVNSFTESLIAHGNDDHFIPFDIYNKSGFLIAVRTNHSQAGELSFEQKGNLNCHFRFANPLAENTVMYLCGKVHSTFEITGDRECVTNYSY